MKGPAPVEEQGPTCRMPDRRPGGRPSILERGFGERPLCAKVSPRGAPKPNKKATLSGRNSFLNKHPEPTWIVPIPLAEVPFGVGAGGGLWAPKSPSRIFRVVPPSVTPRTRSAGRLPRRSSCIGRGLRRSGCRRRATGRGAGRAGRGPRVRCCSGRCGPCRRCSHGRA